MTLGRQSRYDYSTLNIFASHPVKTFVLDRQYHPTGGLYSEGLARSQGPAFLAHNDAVVRTKDWEALKSIHDSSKVADES